MLTAALLLTCSAFLQDAPEARGRAQVYRVDRLETLDGEAVDNATVVVRDGVIEKLGQAVVLPENTEVRDFRGTGSTMLPPLVLSHADFLQRDTRGRGRNGRFRGADSLWLGEDELHELLEEGVLLAGVDPPGSGIPGRTSVLETSGEPPRPEPLVRDLHLKLTVDANSGAKELLRKALKDADRAIEKEEQARKEWEQARKEWEAKQKAVQEKPPEDGGQEGEEGHEEDGAGSAAPLRDGADGKGEKSGKKQPAEEEAPPETFEPPKIDPDLEPVVEWVRQRRVAQVWLSSAHEWLHWLDVLGDRDLPYEVVLVHGSTQDFFEVAAGMAEAGVRAYVPARLSFLPNTRIRANLPRELAAAGVRLVLAPPGPSMQSVRAWRQGLADVVREGLDRKLALKAVTTEAAAALGQEEKVAPLKVGGPATFVVFSGDPLEPAAEAVLLVEDGEVLFDRAEEDDR